MTAQIIDAIDDALKPRGSAVMIDAKHQCMSTQEGFTTQTYPQLQHSLLESLKQTQRCRTDF